MVVGVVVVNVVLSLVEVVVSVVVPLVVLVVKTPDSETLKVVVPEVLDVT